MQSFEPTAGKMQRIRIWWRGRDWKTFLLGIPALAVGLLVIVLGCLCINLSPRELQARYQSEAQAAFKNQDYPRAQTCYERIVILDGSDPEFTFRLALIRENTGDLAQAATLMRSLAPEDRKGYPPAHYWWARKILAADAQSPRSLASAEAHLLRALDGEVEDRNAVHGLLGSLYLNSGKLEDAEYHLTRAVASKPIFRLPLARVYVLRGNPTRARQEAELAVRFFRERAKADPIDIPNRLAWADAESFLENFPTAIQILEEGLAVSQDPLYHLAIARVYTGWFDYKKQQQEVSAGELIALLDQGLRHDPANRDLLNRILEQLHTGGPQADEARQALRNALAKGGTALGPIHFALAIDAHVRGDTDSERFHLDRAWDLDPKSSLVANNLAWLLSQPPSPDYARALALASTAIEREPSNAAFRDTRGKIFLAQGRWKEALSDLEVVLSKSPETPGLHIALAECYQNLGQPLLADEHKKLAAASAKKSTP